MATDRRLTDAFRPLAEALLPDRVLAQERAVGGAINADGTIPTEALTASLPWQRLAWYLEPVVFGTNAGAEHDMPQGGVIRLLRIRAKTPPTTGACTIRVTTGSGSEMVSIAAGESTGASPGLSLTVPPGGVVRIDVASGGGADGVTVTAFYGGL